MAHVICYEVFPGTRNVNRMRTVLVDRHGFVERQNKYGTYFYTETPSIDSWQIKSIIQFHKYKYRFYDKRYERSTNYRKEFFEEHKGPYRCVYCGRKLKASNLEVDHLFPVAKAKASVGARTLMQICGIFDVNDPKNLVASCKRCNRKKSDQMGFWLIRGTLGRSNTFWKVHRTTSIIITIAAIFALYKLLPMII